MLRNLDRRTGAVKGSLVARVLGRQTPVPSTPAPLAALGTNANDLARSFMLLSLHPSLNQIYKRIVRSVDSQIPLLLSGEAGTGKEVLARVIHSAGRFRHTHFTVIPCAVTTEEELELALFTAADATAGMAHSPAGNQAAEAAVTLFLKHVEASSPALQQRLIRLLQEKSVAHPLTRETRRLALRVLASSRKIVEQEVAAGNFRRDLFYRLTITAHVLPPLRERKADIPHFVRHFATRYAARLNEPAATFSAPALAALQEYDWPGNIRECQRVVWQSLWQRTPKIRVIDKIKWGTVENPVVAPDLAEGAGAGGNGDLPGDKLLPPAASPASNASRIQAHQPQFV